MLSTEWQLDYVRAQFTDGIGNTNVPRITPMRWGGFLVYGTTASTGRSASCATSDSGTRHPTSSPWIRSRCSTWCSATGCPLRGRGADGADLHGAQPARPGRAERRVLHEVRGPAAGTQLPRRRPGGLLAGLRPPDTRLAGVDRSSIVSALAGRRAATPLHRQAPATRRAHRETTRLQQQTQPCLGRRASQASTDHRSCRALAGRRAATPPHPRRDSTVWCPPRNGSACSSRRSSP